MGWFDGDSSSEEEEAAPPPPRSLEALATTEMTSPSSRQQQNDEDEEDPLDAFMKTLNPNSAKETTHRASRLDVENEEEATRHWEEHASAVAAAAAAAEPKESVMPEDDEIDPDGFVKRSAVAKRALDETFHKAGQKSQQEGGDSDEEESPKQQSKHVDIHLEKINHAQMKYEPFDRVFWKPLESNNNNSEADQAWRQEHEISVQYPPNTHQKISPIYDFLELKDVFQEPLSQHIHKAGYLHPTPVQAQTLPVALSGHDALITAPTGSGKTLAYVWPMVVHVCDQHHLGPQETGPIGLILVPTRELAQQVQTHVQTMLQPLGGTSLTIIGGMGKYPLVQHLRQKGGVEIVVATPGRLLDVLATKQLEQHATSNTSKKKLTGLSLERTTMVVLDEADRMLQMGFSHQVTQILQAIRPDRQTLLLSATMSNRIEKVAQQWLQGSPTPGIGHANNKKYIRIAIGKTGKASANVQQHVLVLPSQQAKLSWLQQMLPVLCPIGRTLVFCATKEGCEQLAKSLTEALPDTITCITLHGDKHQSARNAALKQFIKQKSVVVLIATDVASRGLDIPQVTTVLNYDPPKNVDIHTHRVGRAGRLSTKNMDGAAQEGTAYTLLRTPQDADIGHVLLGAMEREGREITNDLRQLAQKSRQQRGNSGGSPQSRNRWNKAGLGAANSSTNSDGGGGHYYGPTSAATTANSTSSPPMSKKSRWS